VLSSRYFSHAHGWHRAEYLGDALYYYPNRRRAETVVIPYPVSIGRMDWKRRWVKRR